MVITIEALKEDERCILSNINALTNTLNYNRQLQSFLLKEEDQKEKEIDSNDES